MNPSSSTSLNVVSVDEDVGGQAHTGHGIPSQDPESGAQFRLKPDEAEREAKSALVGGGVVAGVAAGAAIGAAVAGPVGIFVGGTLGTVVGALSAAAAGTAVAQKDASDTDNNKGIGSNSK